MTDDLTTAAILARIPSLTCDDLELLLEGDPAARLGDWSRLTDRVNRLSPPGALPDLVDTVTMVLARTNDRAGELRPRCAAAGHRHPREFWILVAGQLVMLAHATRVRRQLDPALYELVARPWRRVGPPGGMRAEGMGEK